MELIELLLLVFLALLPFVLYDSREKVREQLRTYLRGRRGAIGRWYLNIERKRFDERRYFYDWYADQKKTSGSLEGVIDEYIKCNDVPLVRDKVGEPEVISRMRTRALLAEKSITENIFMIDEDKWRETRSVYSSTLNLFVELYDKADEEEKANIVERYIKPWHQEP